MLGSLLTLGFAAAALFTVVALAASLAKGFAVAAALPRARAAGGDFRLVTVRSTPTSALLSVTRAPTAGRVRRSARLSQAPVRVPERVAA